MSEFDRMRFFPFLRGASKGISQNSLFRGKKRMPGLGPLERCVLHGLKHF